MASDAVLFLDLDGVILDVSKRYWTVHCEILEQLGGDPGDAEEFWTLKRERASLRELTGLDAEKIKEYRRRWSLLIEGPAYLEMDSYLPQARTALVLLKAKYEIVIVSLRHKSVNLREQLKKLDFPRVSQILCAGPKGDPAESKARLMQASPFFSRNAVIAGDTEVDVRAGKDLGLTTIAVRGGLRSDFLLEREGADFTIDGVGLLPSTLKTLFAGGRP